jgi:hypothetical protein
MRTISIVAVTFSAISLTTGARSRAKVYRNMYCRTSPARRKIGFRAPFGWNKLTATADF